MALSRSPSGPPLVTPVLLAGCAILLVGFGTRASFGEFQIPFTQEFDWPRTAFLLAIAVQNLAWDIGQPPFAALAECFSDSRAFSLGAVIYAVGWWLGVGVGAFSALVHLPTRERPVRLA